MGTRLFVGGLPFAADERDLGEAFSAFGQVADVKVIRDPETGRSRGFGFVTMSNDDEARVAIEKMEGGELGGRRVTVREAQEKPRGPGGPGGGGPGGAPGYRSGPPGGFGDRGGPPGGFGDRRGPPGGFGDRRGPPPDRGFNDRGPPPDRGFNDRGPPPDRGFNDRGPPPDRGFNDRGPPPDRGFNDRGPPPDRGFNDRGPPPDRGFNDRGPPPDRGFNDRGPGGFSGPGGPPRGPGGGMGRPQNIVQRLFRGPGGPGGGPPAPAEGAWDEGPARRERGAPPSARKPLPARAGERDDGGGGRPKARKEGKHKLRFEIEDDDVDDE